jgi:hypothetical protein
LSALHDPVAAIRNEFPSWALWHSGTGRWWASFRPDLSAAEQSAGCVPFLHADEPEALAGQIRAQEARRCQHPAGA